MCKQTRIFGTGAVVRRGQFRGAGRIAFEQLAVMTLHNIEMAKQIPGERGSAVVTEETGKTFHRFNIVG